ncbi:MAG: hypothetical protein KDD82_00375, partial [Planctomycetes bacterium]|nr:hypothetical protein [Planctomycetota bacterium]
LVQENAKLRETPRGGQRTSGGGMLAGLVQENAKLRETPRGGQRASGGGLLAGLVQENAKLRATPASAPVSAAPEAQAPEAEASEEPSEVRVALLEECPADPESADAADDDSTQPRKQSFARSLAAVLGLGGRGRVVEDDSPGGRQAG